MIVLAATEAQKNALEGTYGHDCVLKFIEDALGNWVVNIHVIENGQFLEIREQLSALPRIEYVPKEIEI